MAPADGAGDPCQELQPLETVVKGVLENPGQGGPGESLDLAGPRPWSQPLGPVSDDEAPVSFVREKDIEPSAYDIMRDTGLAGEPDRGRKLLGRRRLEEEVGRAADPEAGQLLQGDIPGERLPDGLEERGGEFGVPVHALILDHSLAACLTALYPLGTDFAIIYRVMSCIDISAGTKYHF